MTTITATRAEPRRGPLFWAVSDTLAITWRNLITVVRTPQLIVFSTIQPVIFVFLFRYVFGGAIRVTGVPYVDYLIPGVFVQVITFGAINTGVGLAEDLRKGLIERFRSLPMARPAVLAGRSLADLVRNSFVVALMAAVGFGVGFRVHTDAVSFLAAMGVLLFFAFAITWVYALVGMSVGNAETAQAASFPVGALLVFASSAFVPTQGMPGWLQVYAQHQPVTATADAVRVLVLGGPAAAKVLTSLAWSAGILAVFAPLAVWRYRRSS